MSAYARRIAALGLLLAAAGATAADSAPPQSVTATYEVSWNRMRVAVVSETFESGGGGYRIVSTSNPVGPLALIERHALHLASNGQLTPAGLRPLHFEGKRGDDDPRQAQADFDWAAGRITLRHDGRADTLPLPPGAQDRISAQYQFMFAAPAGRQVEFAMTNGRKIDHYVYSVEPGIELDTRLGRLATVRLVKQHRADESGAELWLSPQHHYLAVKVVIQEENGARYEQVITGLDIKP